MSQSLALPPFPMKHDKTCRVLPLSASFGRQLEYYTGMVFKIVVKSKTGNINLINGGRYDNLMADLGSSKKISAVGAAINLNN